MNEDRAAALIGAALDETGLADMRPAYRRLLVRLKQEAPAAFDEASRRYREELEPSIASGEADPIVAWLEYGIWLAGQLAGGKTLAIDDTGRAHPFEPEALASGSVEPGSSPLVLHVPDDDRAPVTLLAVPTSPSDPQKETADLLVR